MATGTRYAQCYPRRHVDVNVEDETGTAGDGDVANEGEAVVEEAEAEATEKSALVAKRSPTEPTQAQRDEHKSLWPGELWAVVPLGAAPIIWQMGPS